MLVLSVDPTGATEALALLAARGDYPPRLAFEIAQSQASVPGSSTSSSSQAHLAASAPFQARPRGPVSGRLSATTSRRGLELPVAVSRCLSATGVRFSAIRFPPRDWALLTVGLPTQRVGPRRGYRVPHTRATTRGGRPLYPEDHGAHPARSRSPTSVRRFAATSPCTPPQPSIDAGLCSTRHQPGVHTSSPVRSSPRLTLPDGTGTPWLSPELRTPPTGAGRRTSGRGQAIEHGPETTLYVIDPASNPACSLVMCDLASHATKQKQSGGWRSKNAPCVSSTVAPASSGALLGGIGPLPDNEKSKAPRVCADRSAAPRVPDSLALLDYLAH